ncbi:hypothetical protein CPSG_05607 [Coccidioides posadasii str. Silveira]|uniref:Uncharacterized protein n=1 Tax=Coccidioides posadasii (strain RMSCC 757 / Silveira) TaxID=443226 RepID=E9D6U8_COCPS|nr:hypothetical protein CPSG_05607 [Coccidioides posadasii str. Silveira]
MATRHACQSSGLKNIFSSEESTNLKILSWQQSPVLFHVSVDTCTAIRSERSYAELISLPSELSLIPDSTASESEINVQTGSQNNTQVT